MADKLKKVYENEEEIPEALRDYYSKTGDGWSFIGIDDAEDRSKASEFRNRNIELIKQNEALQKRLEKIEGQFKDINPDDIRTAMSMIDQMKADEEKEMLKRGKIDEVVERRMKAAMDDSQKQLKIKDEAMTKAVEESKALRSRLGELLIDREIQLKLSDAKVSVQEGALPDVLSRAKETWKINDQGQMVPMERDPGTGNYQTRYGKNGQPLTMEEYVSGLVGSAAHLFRPSTGGGSPGRSHESGGKPGGKKVVNFSNPLDFGRNLEAIAKGEAVDANSAE